MAYDLKREEEVQEYIKNLGIEYRFGCYKEKKPQVCHLLGDYLEAIQKDFEKAGRVYKSNCLDYNYGKSCLKYGNYTLMGKGRDAGNMTEALSYFEKGCELGDPTSCLHAGLMLTATGPKMTLPQDIPKGYNYLKKSCDEKEGLACHHLAGMYIRGVPKNKDDVVHRNPEKNKHINFLIKPDMKQAFTFDMKACEMGNPFACANISMMYAKGHGVSKNEKLAEKYKKITIELQNAHETAKTLQFQQGLNDTN